MVACASALPTQLGEVYHEQPIPAGYTRVGVEKVCEGYETLELDIPRGDGEMTLAEAIHGWILWEKHHIILKPAEQTSKASISTISSKGTQHESTISGSCTTKFSFKGPSMSPMSPASSLGQPSSPPSSHPSLAKKQKQPSKKQSSVKEPPKKKQQLKKKSKEARTKP
jgi:hypothetical protein